MNNAYFEDFMLCPHWDMSHSISACISYFQNLKVCISLNKCFTDLSFLQYIVQQLTIKYKTNVRCIKEKQLFCRVHKMVTGEVLESFFDFLVLCHFFLIELFRKNNVFSYSVTTGEHACRISRLYVNYFMKYFREKFASE